MRETTASLTQQAHDAMDRTIAERGVWLDNDAQAAARAMWLDGFKAGMDATKALAEAAITKTLS